MRPLRILLSYAAEYDTGEGIHYARVLRRLGHHVHEVNVAAAHGASGARGFTRGYPSDITIDELTRAAGGADLFLYLEVFGLVPRGLESSPIPTACVLCDTHRNPRARRDMARLFDHVFVYHRNHVAMHAGRAEGSVRWIPYACDTEVVRDLRLTRDYDVAFVGRLYSEERRRIVGRLSERYAINPWRTYRQQEIPEVYSRARIVVDVPDGDNIPFRVFEAMSCGAMLITKRLRSGIEELFREGEHYEAYDDERELFEKVDWYLRHESRRAAVAARGHEEVLARHTLAHRVSQMIDAVEDGPRLAAPVRSMTPAARDRAYAQVYERMGRVDSLLALAHTAPDALTRWLWRYHACRAFARRMILGW